MNRLRSHFFTYSGYGFCILGVLKASIIFGKPSALPDVVFPSITTGNLMVVAGISELALGLFLLSGSFGTYWKALACWATVCFFVGYRFLAEGGQCPCAGVLAGILPPGGRQALDIALVGWLWLLGIGSVVSFVLDWFTPREEPSPEFLRSEPAGK